MPRMRVQSRETRARNQRLYAQARRNDGNFQQLATKFEELMVRVNFSTCNYCWRRVESKDVRSNKCRSCSTPGHVNLFSLENRMNVGEVPPELQGLSMTEEILIARVHPVVSVFRIRGQQLAYSGHVMNFTQHVETLVTRLPSNPGNLNCLLILSRQTPSGLAHFRVRGAKIRAALIWLKRYNPYYSDIILDEEVLALLPADGDVSSSIPTISTVDTAEGEGVFEPDNQINISCFPHTSQIDSTSEIQRNLRGLAQAESLLDIGEWPAVSQNRLNEFTTEGMVCQAFPTLFPRGIGDLRAPRLKEISAHKYFKYLMEYYDGRFANHIRFPYYAYNSTARWDALKCGNIYVRNNEFEGLNAEDIAHIVNDPSHDLASSIMYYAKNLRGTRAFWKQRSSELIQMVRQLGTPTIFFTLSAADYHWPDLFRLLSRGRNEDLTEATRRKLMHENPSIVSWFFEKRCQIFIKEFLIKFFNVTDFWYRFEWQHRGSPHVHGLLWITDSPDCSDIDSMSEIEKSNIVEYFDQMVSAWVERVRQVSIDNNPCRQRLTELLPEERIDDLDRLLCAVQRHSRCGSYCLRKRRGTNRLECRYRFPMQLEETSSLRKEEGSWKFFPKRNDVYVQRFNPFLTRIWRGNTDFSPITSKDAVINYISKYASKAEHGSESYSKILDTILSHQDSNVPAAMVVKQLLCSSLAERNYSAQEVMHLMMGWPLYHSSRSVIALFLGEEWRRYGDRPALSFVDRYSRRHPRLATVSLFEFAKKFRFVGERMIQRRKECVVRVLPHLTETEDESNNQQYYQLQCKLHIPWRGDFDELKPSDVSWHDFYISHLEDIQNADEYPDEFPQEPDEFELNDENEELSNIVRDAGMVASRYQPDVNEERDPIGRREIDEAMIWNNFDSVQTSGEEIDQYLRSFRGQIGGIERIRMVALDRNSLTPEQRIVLDILRDQVNATTNYRRVIVQGKAGTGKSTLIRSMCEHLLLHLGQDSFQVLAPTGAAALNIDGKTIHSFLRIPINSKLTPLNGLALRTFQLSMKNIRFILIDEYSMVGMRLLYKIHRRLCEAKGSIEDFFGGCYVYLFGDLRQLPPVKDIAIYMQPKDDFSRGALPLIASFDRKIVLKQCQRQGPDQQAFTDVLDSIANGRVSERGYDYLMTRRQFECQRRQDLRLFQNAVHLFATNSLVRELNQRVLASNRHPVAIVESLCNCTTARQGSEDQAQGLPKQLLISIGCRIMLRKNLCVEKGLVNGALGSVRDIIYLQGEHPPALPYAVMIEFDKFSGPYFPNYPPFVNEKLFPVRPVLASWKDKNVDCTRKQLPIILAYAMTIHKAQGMTLDQAIVDIGDKELAPGSSYVGLSRVRKLEDMVIARQFSLGRLRSIATMPMVIARERFLSQFLQNS